MDNKQYSVIILKTEITEPVVTRLAKLFKLSDQKIQAILQKDHFIVKKQTSKETAEKFHKAITSAGANCQLEECAPEEQPEEALPTIEDVKVSSEGKPLTDITRPEILPLHQEQMNLGLVEQEKSSQKEDIPQAIDPENFCPECGTIRETPELLCIHCGYDPQEIPQSSKKPLIIKSIAAVIVLLISAFFAFPYYQQYIIRSQIETDLQLAFDTRNQITAFIQKTHFWPNQNIDAGLSEHLSNNSIKSIILSKDSLMTITIKAQALGGNSESIDQTLIFTPNTLKGRIVWNCLKGTLKEKWRPKICLRLEKPE